MGTRAVVLVLLAAFHLVLSQNLFPQGPFRAFQGDFLDFGIPLKGNVSLNIGEEEITNIITLNNVTKGGVSVDILEGGVGHSYVSFTYQVTSDAKGFFDVYILTSETSNLTDLVERRGRHPFFSYTDYFMFNYNATHESSNSSRTDKASFSFDHGISNCNGFSTWYNGNGSRQVKGGLIQNYLDVALEIPEGVSGSSAYTCYYYNDTNTRDVGPVKSFKVASDDDVQVALLQYYDTMRYYLQPHFDTSYLIFGYGYEVLSYEGSFVWENGTGEVVISDGGVGDDHISFDVNYTADYSYGYLDYNVLFKSLF